jgi:peptidyl-prolyl cis-trans isomerase C
VKSQFGWHVIKVEDKRQQQPPAFEQVEQQLRSMAFRDKYFALVKQLRGQADVSISDPALKTAVQSIEAQQQ